ncbi:MAG: hypothetical protein PHI53_01600 [Candidatus Pacebacteria bacterium]|nr:hypothetical protein [Candidatus Paceibacterota bacterium]
MNNKIKDKINGGNIYLKYKAEDKSVKQIKKYIIDILKKLKTFYKINNLKFNIELFYSRKEFNRKIGYKTPDWLVGFAFKNNIYLVPL